MVSLRKMHAVGADAQREIGIIGNDELQPAPSRNNRQRQCQFAAMDLRTRTYNDKTAARQLARSRERIVQAIVIYQQDKRRQQAGMAGGSVECGCKPC